MKTLLSLTFILFIFPLTSHAASPGEIVISEVAWMGTVNSHNDEWMELYNNMDSPLSLEGWTLNSTDGTPSIYLTGTIAPNSFFLLERTDDTTVSSHEANQVYTGALGNSGEHLELRDAQGNLVDDVNAFGNWFAGDNISATERKTMERKNPTLAGSGASSWATSLNVGGTPKAQNSVYQQGEASPPSPPPIQEPPLVETDPSPEPTATSTPESATTTPAESLPPTYPSGVFINELMPSPPGSDTEEEWIEIRNENNEKADISSWQIRDTLGAINTYTFPGGSSIAARAFLVLSRPTTGITMNNDEDAMELLRPDGEIIQTIPYSKAQKGQSYARTETGWEWSVVPTPGSANITPQPQAETKKAPPDPILIPKAQSNHSGNTSIHTRENPRDLEKESTATTTQAPMTNTSSAQTAAIGDVAPQSGFATAGQAPKTQNAFIYIVAPLIALLSAIFVFLLKKRLQS